MRVLVVTGGIGSGKSLVCRMLEQSYGIPVYEADAKVKALYSKVPSILDEIEESLGVKLRNEAGDFVPRMLADVIFSDKLALQKVEDIIFPHLMDDFNCWAMSHGSDVVAFESATVLEKPQFDGFGDIVLLVDAPVQTRLNRACQRDQVNREKIQERISLQIMMNYLSEGGHNDRINYRIVNDGTINDLETKLKEFIEKYGLTKML